MRVSIDPRRSAWENAATYFELAKKLKRKAESAAAEIAKTEAELAELQKRTTKQEKVKPLFTEKEFWFEKFRWFITSGGFLAIGGKNAKQNRTLVRKYFLDNDLFFHVEGYPGAVVILKNGTTATKRDLVETAQFAACYSDAWKEGLPVATVFSAKKEQVSFALPSGFAIKGKKIFKNVKLALLVGISAEKLIVIPEAATPARFESCYEILPGPKGKEEAAKELAKEYGNEEKLLGLIPRNCTSRKVK